MKKIILTVTVLICLFFANSCNKNEDLNIEKTFVNPYDFIGQEHNKALIALNNDKMLSSENFKDRWENLRFNIANSQNIDKDRIISFNKANGEFSKLNKKKSDYLDMSISQLAIELYNSNKINIIQKQYLINLDTIFIENYGNENFGHLIVEFENKINLDNQLNEEQKKIIFVATAISKYSESFWTDAKNNPDNPYHYLFTKKGLKSWREWLIGACDVVGGVAGLLLTGGDPWGGIGLGGFCSVGAYMLLY